MLGKVFEELEKFFTYIDVKNVTGDEELARACSEDIECRKLVSEMKDLEYKLNKDSIKKKIKDTLNLKVLDYDCMDIKVYDRTINCDSGSILIEINGIKIKFTCSEWGFIEVIE